MLILYINSLVCQPQTLIRLLLCELYVDLLQLFGGELDNSHRGVLLSFEEEMLEFFAEFFI
jgi:hypothetical protein